MNDGVEQQAYRIDEEMPLFALDLFARIIAMRINARAAFFGAFHALTVDDSSGGTGFSPLLLAALHIKRMMDTIQRAVVAPQVEIIMHRAARRQVLRKCPPLASRGQDVHDRVHDFACTHATPVSAGLGWRNQRFDQRPFFIGEITRISQLTAVIAPAVFRRPHTCPRPQPNLHLINSK